MGMNSYGFPLLSLVPSIMRNKREVSVPFVPAVFQMALT